MRAPAILALLGAGCLSRPTGRPDDAGPDAAGPGWPPAGATVGRTLARDLDGDGDAELVVTTDEGVYVLPGGPGFGAAYASFVATPFPPLAVDVADLGGAAAPELAVLGVAGATPRVLVHEGQGGLAFADAAWARDEVDLAPSATEPRGVWLLDSDGDGTVNVLASDDVRLEIGEPAAFTQQALFEMPLVHAEGWNSSNFQSIRDLFVLPGAAGAGTADLAIVDVFGVGLFRGDGNDLYPGTARVDVGAQAYFEVSARADVDGDGVPEVIGGYNNFLNGISVAGTPSWLQYQGPGPGDHVSMDQLAARLAQLDADPGERPDLLVANRFADVTGPQTDTELVAIPNLTLAAGIVDTVSDVTVREVLPGLAASVETADFDGDGATEIVVVAPDGALTCRRLGDGAFTGC